MLGKFLDQMFNTQLGSVVLFIQNNITMLNGKVVLASLPWPMTHLFKAIIQTIVIT